MSIANTNANAGSDFLMANTTFEDVVTAVTLYTSIVRRWQLEGKRRKSDRVAPAGRARSALRRSTLAL